MSRPKTAQADAAPDNHELDYAEATSNDAVNAAAAVAEHKAKAEAAKQADPDAGFLYVLDRSATAVSGSRTHDLLMTGGIVKPFVFEYGKPNRLPFEIAVRFLKHDGFLLTDKDGEPQPWAGVPKRPEDLQAGEKLVISDAECVARYDELTDRALKLRAAMLPQSEEVVRQGPRERVIKFIVDHNARMKAQNTVSDRAPDEWTPPPIEEY